MSIRRLEPGVWGSHAPRDWIVFAFAERFVKVYLNCF
ncbi:protein of unknown function [Pararobbsia alpina]